MARRGKFPAPDDPNQLLIDWKPAAAEGKTIAAPAPVETAALARPAVEPLVQRLPWDFKTSFPQPTDDAIDNGLLDETDRQPENLRSLHENYFAQCLATLKERDAIVEARRKQIDPKTGSRPRSHAGRERLRSYLEKEPGRLEHMLEILIGGYADAFGVEAADAFRKAVKARHAGIEIVSEHRSEAPAPAPVIRRTRRSAPSSALPVPRALQSSVKAGIFGHQEDGTPVRPDAAEVRAITEQHAESMIEMNDIELQSAVSRYAEDFGPKAAAQLERFVRRRRDAEHSR
jgi:hypothetical protein